MHDEDSAEVVVGDVAGAEDEAATEVDAGT
jgi:hypothetical protein